MVQFPALLNKFAPAYNICQRCSPSIQYFLNMADPDSGKKRSLENNCSSFEEGESKTKIGRLDNVVDMSDFKLVKVLSENAKSKTLILHLQGIYTCILIIILC